MQYQFEVSSFSSAPPVEPVAAPATETIDLLRQMLEVQREQLAYLRAAHAAHDLGARWRAFLSRWQHDFPDLADGCRKALPVLERTYGKILADLSEHLCDSGTDALDNDFALQEFLDRYGMRLAQLGTILNLVAPLAEAGSQE